MLSFLLLLLLNVAAAVTAVDAKHVKLQKMIDEWWLSFVIAFLYARIEIK